MPKKPGDEPRGRADELRAATQVRLTDAQLRGVELIAQQREIGKSTAIRELVAEALRAYEAPSGVNLLEHLEAEVAAENVQAKQLAHFFGTAAEG